jgi:fibronectin-binding autotransporter adhesin
MLGGTTIAAGTLLLGASERLADAGTLRLTGGVLDLGGFSETLAAVTLEAGTLTTGTLSGTSYSVWSGVLNANLAGGGALTKSMAGTVTLTTASTYSGGTTVAAGTLALAVDNALNAAGPVNITGGELALGTTSQTVGAFSLLNGSLTGGTLTGASYSVENGWISTVLSGTAALVKDNAAGRVTLNAAANYSGGTTLSAGTLVLGLNNALNATGAVRVVGGELVLGTSTQQVGVLTLDGGMLAGGSLFGSAYALNAGTVGTVLAGTAAMVKDSAGTVRLTVASVFSGGTTLKAGRLELGLSDALLTTGDFTLEGGVLDLLGNSQTVGVLTLSGGLVTGGTLEGTGIELQAGVVDTVLTGNVGVRKTTAGLVTLMQSNEYTGLTDVVAGTLQLGASERIRNSTALRVSGGVFDLQNFEETVGAVTLASGVIRGGTLTGSGYLVQSGTVDAVLSGTAALVKSGVGLVSLNARNAYTGGTTVNAGTLTLGIDQALFAGTALTIDGAGAELALGATVQSVGAVRLLSGSLTGGTLSASGYTVESGDVSTLLAGNGAALVKNQTGTLTLAAQNSYTGGTTLNDGMLSLAVSNALAAAGNVTVNGGLLALGVTEQAVAAFRLSGGSLSGGTLAATQFTVEAGTVSTVLAGTAVLTKNSTGTVLLNAANLYTEGTVLNAGTLLLGASERLAAAGVLTVKGGVFDLGGFNQTTGVVTLTGGTITNGVLTGGSYALAAGDVSAVLAGGARLVKSGAGTVTLSAVNTYTGGTFLEAGRLVLAGDNRLDSAYGLTLTGGVLDLGNATTGASTLDMLAGTVEAGTLTVSGAIVLSSGTISAGLTGAASLTKNTAGTMLLSGVSSYTGGTTLNAGTLRLSGTNVLAAGGSLDLLGGVLDLGAVAQAGGAVLLRGGTVKNGTLASTAGFTFENGSVNALLAAGAVVKQTTGKVTLGIADTLASITELTVSQGELALGGLRTNAPLVTLTGGTISNGTLQSTAGFVFESGTVRADLAGAGSLLKSGAGTVLLGGLNRYTGGTTLDAGSLVLGANGVLTATAQLTQNGGVFDLGGFSTGSGTYTLNNGLIRNGTLNATRFELGSGTVDALLAGTGRALKTTDGTVLLNGGIATSGDLVISGGTLLLGASDRINDVTRLLLEAGGTLDLGGFSERVGRLQLKGGSVLRGTLEADIYEVTSGVVGVGLTGAGALEKVSDGTAGGGLALLTAVNSYTGGTTVSAGTLLLGGANRLNISGSLAVRGGTFDMGGYSQTISVGSLESGVITGGTLFATDSFRLQSGLVSAVLGGTASLRKSGAGLVTLTQVNEYVGETAVSAGTLQLLASGGMGTGNALSVSGGSLRLGGVQQVAGTVTLTGGLIEEGTLSSTALNLEAGRINAELTGSARLVKASTGTVSLGALNRYTGGTWVKAGTLDLLADGALSTGGTLLVDGGVLALGATTQAAGAVTLNGGSITGGVLSGTSFAVRSGLISSVLSGPASLVKSTGGTVVLSGQNQYSGDTIVEAGLLTLAGNQVLSSAGALTLNGGSVDLGGSTLNVVRELNLNSGRIFGGAGAVATLSAGAFLVKSGTVSAMLTGAGALTKDGDGTLDGGTVFLNGQNSYAGATTVNAGRLVLAGEQVLAQGAELTVNGGVLELGGQFKNAVLSLTLNGGAIRQGTLEAGSYLLSSGEISSVLAGTGALTKIGGGTVTLRGQNTYTGETQVSGGRLVLGGSQVLSEVAALTVGAATLDLGGSFTNKVAALTLDGGVISNGRLEAASMLVYSGTVSTVLGGNGALTKAGQGELLLNVAATYTGGTALNGGVLRLAGGQFLSPTGTVSIAAGGTLDLGGYSTGTGALLLDGGVVRNGSLSASSFDLRSGVIEGVLSGAGLITKSTVATVLLNGLIAGSGALELNGGSLQLGASDRINDNTVVRIQEGATLDLGGFNERVGRLQLKGGSVLRGTLEADIYEVTSGVVGVGLTGAGALEKVSDGTAGGGLALLTAVNAYTGGTTVSAGTLLLGGANRLNISGSLAVRGGTFDMGGYSQTVSVGSLESGVITGGTLFATDSFRLQSGLVSAVLGGTASLRKSGAGLVTLTQVNEYVGETAVSAGTLQLLASGGMGTGNALSVSGGSLRLGGVQQVAGTVTLTGGLIEEGILSSTALNLEAGRINAELTGSARLVKASTGTVSLGALNRYTGGTWVKAGTLDLLADGALSTGGTLLVDGGVLALGATTQAAGAVTLNGGSITGGVLSGTSFAVRSGLVASVLSGPASLVKSTGGTVVLSGQNQYSGDTIVEAGLLTLAGNQVLSSAGALTLNGGSVDLGGSTLNVVRELNLNSGRIFGGAGAVATLSAGAFLVKSGTVSAMLTGAGALTKDGDGTLDGGTVFLNGQNSYAGATTVNAGRLVLAGEQVLAQGAELTVNGGVLELGGQFKNAVLSLTLNGGAIRQGTLEAGSYLLSSGEISSVLAGTGALTKIGGGTVTLRGQNTYTGETQVSGGRLVLGGSQVLSEVAALTVGAATLDLGGSFTNKVAALTLDGGVISNGRLEAASMLVYSGTVSTVLGGNGALTKAGQGELLLNVAATYTGGTALNGGVLRLAGGQFLSPTGTVSIAAGGTLDLGGYSTGTGALLLDGGVVRNGSLSASSFDLRSGVIEGVLSGAGLITKSTVATVLLNGLIAGSGALELNGGSLQLGASDRINDNTVVRIQEGATLDLGGFSERVGRLRLGGGSIVRGTLEAAVYDVTSGVLGVGLVGSGSLEKLGDGTAGGGLALMTGVGTYTGATRVTAGTLQLGGDNRIHVESALSVQGGTLDLGGFSQNSNSSVLSSGQITNGTLNLNQLLEVQSGRIDALLAGTGTLTKTTGGTVVLANVNQYTGGTTVAAGTLQLSLAGALGSGNALRVEGGSLLLGGVAQAAGVVTLTGGVIAEGALTGTAFNLSAGTVAAALRGTGSLVKENSGTVLLNSVNSYTGVTRVDAGTLVLGADGALTLNSELTVNGGLLSLGTTTQTLGALTLNGGEIAGGTVVASGYAVRSGTVSSVLAGIASLVKTTEGLVTLSGLNRYQGNTTVDAGTLVLGGSNVLFASGVLTVNGGTLDLGGAYQNTVSLLQLNGGRIVGGGGAGATISAGSFLVASGTIDAVLAGAGALTKNTEGTVFLKGQNAYTGLTTVNAGRLVLGGNQVLSGTAALQVNGGLLDLGGQYTNSVQTVTLVDGAIERGTVGADAFNVFNGLISANLTGAGALTKTGAGTVTLSGQNSYTGETQVLGGRLVLGGSQVLSRTAAVTVRGGILDLGGDFLNEVGLLTLDGGALERGTLTPVLTLALSGSVSAVVAGSGSLTKESAGELLLQSASSTYTGGTFLNAGTLRLAAGERLADVGALTVSGGTFELGGFRETLDQVALLGGEIRNGTLAGSAFTLASGPLTRNWPAWAPRCSRPAPALAVINTAASYTGGTTVENGVLALGGSLLLHAAGALSVTGGELALGTTAQNIGAFRLTGGLVTGGSLTGTVYTVENGTVTSVLAGAGSPHQAGRRFGHPVRRQHVSGQDAGAGRDAASRRCRSADGFQQFGAGFGRPPGVGVGRPDQSGRSSRGGRRNVCLPRRRIRPDAAVPHDPSAVRVVGDRRQHAGGDG